MSPLHEGRFPPRRASPSLRHPWIHGLRWRVREMDRPDERWKKGSLERNQFVDFLIASEFPLWAGKRILRFACGTIAHCAMSTGVDEPKSQTVRPLLSRFSGQPGTERPPSSQGFS